MDIYAELRKIKKSADNAQKCFTVGDASNSALYYINRVQDRVNQLLETETITQNNNAQELKIIEAQSASELVKLVTAHVKEGWELNGETIYCDNSYVDREEEYEFKVTRHYWAQPMSHTPQ